MVFLMLLLVFFVAIIDLHTASTPLYSNCQQKEGKRGREGREAKRKEIKIGEGGMGRNRKHTLRLVSATPHAAQCFGGFGPVAQ
jgi:hypothetical protein